MGEMHENITPRQLCKMTSTDEDTMRIRFAKLRKTNPVLFPSPWRIEGELTPDQIKALIQAGQRKGGAPKEDTERAAAFAANATMRPEAGQSNEAAPQGMEMRSWVKANLKITRLDVVFYATTGTACAGFITAFQWWGIPVSLVYSLILIDAMGMAKDVELQKTAERGSAAVIVFEIIAGFAHTYVFNTVMWRNYKSLPFEIEQRVSNGVLTWHNGDKPFFIAVCIAVILSGSAIYAVDTTIKKTRERVKNLAK